MTTTNDYRTVAPNEDKPHRCPECHEIPDEARKDGRVQQGKMYECAKCSVRWVAPESYPSSTTVLLGGSPTNFVSHFIAKVRDKTNSDGAAESFITLADDRPEWLQTAVRETHQGTLPNDWIYEECRAAVEAFDEGTLDDSEENDGDVHAYADSRVDVYTKALYEWAADFCLTETWSTAEQEAKDMGLPEETTKRIVFIQYAAIRHIADTMRQACIAAVKNTHPSGSIGPTPGEPHAGGSFGRTPGEAPSGTTGPTPRDRR